MTPEFPVHGRLAFAESFVEPILAGEKTATVRLPGECDAGALEAAATEAGVVEFETPAGTAFARADVRSVWRVDAATLSRAQLAGHEADLDSAAAVRELLRQFYPEHVHALADNPPVLVAAWDVVEAVGDREGAGEPAVVPDGGERSALGHTIVGDRVIGASESEVRRRALPDGSGEPADAIALTERQRERIEEIKQECTEGGRLPEPPDGQILKSLLDTWDAVGDGHYSAIPDGGENSHTSLDCPCCDKTFHTSHDEAAVASLRYHLGREHPDVAADLATALNGLAYRERALDRGRPRRDCECADCTCRLHTYPGDEKCIWCRNGDHARRIRCDGGVAEADVGPVDRATREWPSEEFDGTTVGATPKGAHYHDDLECRHLYGRKIIRYDKSAAWYKGLDPCGDCGTWPEHELATDGGAEPVESGRYCCNCDGDTAEVETDHDGVEICPRCKSTVYDDYEEYRDEMVSWLGDRYDLSESEVVEFLITHGNPNKGQAAAILTPDDDLRADGGDDEQVYFRTREHPDHPANPEGKDCVKCGESAFIVTQRLETVEDGLNRVVTGEPLCREHFREISGYDDDGLRADGGSTTAERRRTPVGDLADRIEAYLLDRLEASGDGVVYVRGGPAAEEIGMTVGHWTNGMAELRQREDAAVAIERWGSEVNSGAWRVEPADGGGPDE